MKTVALTAALGLAATALAAGVAASGSGAATAFEWSVYGRWLRAHQPVSPVPVVVVRDPASEARLGSGAWDRAVLAGLVTSLSRAGAAVIGLDAPLGQPSAPGRGGASSDALLSQAIALAENVVLPIALEPTDLLAGDRPGATGGSAVPQHRSWPLVSTTSPALPLARALTPSLPGFAQSAKSVGHTLAPADPDGVIRRVPLFVRVGDRGVPAFGLALAAAFTSVDAGRIPVDRDGNMLAPSSRQALPRGLKVVPFADIWTAIDERQQDALQRLVADRIVLLLVEPKSAGDRSVVQAHLLDRLLAGAWLRETPAAWTVLGSLVLSGLAAWLWLSVRWWKAALTTGLLALGYLAGVFASASLIGVLLPLAIPLIAVSVSSASALVWNQLTAAYRIRDLEGEVTQIREGLVHQESAVEALEEDLEAARAAVARSTGGEEALRAQLAAARAQEEQTRARLDELERRAKTLTAGELREAPLGDAEQERLQRECERLGIVTRDPAMLALFRDLEKAARSSLPIVIAGEPGTGKELFARAAHRLSPRADGPFVAVNMGAIPAELFESEMFGHVRGSFTGAVADRKGLFEQANRGTIFLDEVGELHPEHQSKLLRVLQDKSFYRVGAPRPTTVDVRVVAASNRDLERGSVEGWFREDLYFRLKGLVLRLPPLRERRADVPLLAARFVREAAAEVGRPALPLSDAALAALERNDWPGNARELQNCLRQALALADGNAITVGDLRLATREPSREDSGGDESVLAMLRQHGFDMQATARALGWDRSTVTQRLKGLGFRALVDAGGDRTKAALTLAGEPALARTVELKLREYSEHLLRVVEGFSSPDEAIAACRRRFKNLPERHFRSLELLVRQHFDRRSSTARV
jgi:DNA-binding NtrC family response regulator/CHASE2 domain-containing sensor protein